ncbi:zf-HC2 domain-containing protein [Streptomyces sp. NBC_00820]|uniref:anti-sigma factor family protein n=1 Tax=Streptomyces sp. NBC_00820 TaxID=2975842 RepID=UPI002ED6BF49|nr:zf-HC2 domain-containing protein [Streptomyces sp. NBC_00820]
MSGSRPNPAETHFAEQHLGDRLSALVDGELGHESRERVLAHLVTCNRCKAEADAQRRLKNVFAEAAPPPPSESFLARLQGLPGGGDLDGGGTPTPGGGFLGRGAEDGLFGVSHDERFAFGYVPAAAVHAVAPGERGFRIHPVGRPEADRSASRGMRFAFAAAGAVSLAAVALGGVTTALPGDLGAEARGGSGTGSNVSPTRSSGTGTGTAAPDAQRRRSAGPLPQGSSLLGPTPVAPTSMSAPLLPGMPTPISGPVQDTARDLTGPVMAGAAVVSPLIRPMDDVAPLTLTTRSAVPQTSTPSPSAYPPPGSASASGPSATASRRAP